MESWLPWLTADEHAPDRPAAGDDAQVAARRAPPHARPGRRPARRGGRPRRAPWPRPGARPPTQRDHGFPALHLDFDRLLARHRGTGVARRHRARQPRHRRRSRAAAGTRSSATAAACSPALAALLSRRLPRRRRAPTATGSADRLAAARRARRRSRSRHRRRAALPARRHRRRRPARPRRGPARRKLAVLAEADLTGRRRAHRRARPRRRDAERLLRRPQGRRLRRAPPARRRPATTAWSSGRSAGSSATTCCSSTRAATSSTSRPTRSTPSATTPAARARRCTAWAAPTGRRPRPGSARRCAEIAQELVVLYQKRLHDARPRLRARTRPWQREIEDAFPYEETPDQLHGHRRRQGRHGASPSRWTAWCAATSASARPRWRSGPRSRRSRTASRWRCSCPTTLLAQQHGQTFSDRFAGYPVRVEVLSPLPHRRPGQQGRRGRRDRRGRHRHRHPPPALRATCAFKDLGLLVVDEEQRFGVQPQGDDQAARRPTSTCSRSPPRRSPARSR